MKVSVIIPVWNQWSLTKACLESLALTSPDALEIIVIDNCSTDTTREALEPLGKQLFGHNFLTRALPENAGFARACNIGAGMASGDLLFFLNNDTSCKPGWLEPLTKAFASGNYGAVGPLLLYPNGTVQHCGIFFTPFHRVGHLYEKFPAIHPLISKKRPLQAITGAALMLPKNLFFEAGSFFEEYVNGFEDMDLCFSITSKGYRLGIIPQSQIYHHTSQTQGRFDHELPNSELLFSRWQHYFKPDLHIFGRLDGFDFKIGPDLSCWLELPDQQSDKLASSLSDIPSTKMTASLCQMLEEFPLWRKGWHTLVDTLAMEHHDEQAALAGLKAMQFFGDDSLEAKVISIASHNPDLASYVKSPPVSASVSTIPNEENILKMRLARKTASRQGDLYLANLMDQWLDNIRSTSD